MSPKDFDKDFIALDDDAFGNGSSEPRPLGGALVRAVDSNREHVQRYATHSTSTYHFRTSTTPDLPRPVLSAGRKDSAAIWHAFYVARSDAESITVTIVGQIGTPSSPSDSEYIEIGMQDSGDKVRYSGTTLSNKASQDQVIITLDAEPRQGWHYIFVNCDSTDRSSDVTFKVPDDSRFLTVIGDGTADWENRSHDFMCEFVDGNRTATVDLRTLHDPDDDDTYDMRVSPYPTALNIAPDRLQASSLYFLDTPRLLPISVDVEVSTASGTGRQTPDPRRADYPVFASDAVYPEARQTKEEIDPPRVLARDIRVTEFDDQLFDVFSGVPDASSEPSFAYGGLLIDNDKNTARTAIRVNPRYRLEVRVLAFGQSEIIGSEFQLEVGGTLEAETVYIPIDCELLTADGTVSDSVSKPNSLKAKWPGIVGRGEIEDGQDTSAQWDCLVDSPVSWDYREGCWSDRREPQQLTFRLDVKDADFNVGDLAFVRLSTPTRKEYGTDNHLLQVVSVAVVEVA